MKSPHRWTSQELRADAEKARAKFRRERLEEPRELYSRFYQAFVPVFTSLVDNLPRIADDKTGPAAVAEMVRDKNLLSAFCYLAAPPISEDDLKTLARTTLTPTALFKDRAQAKRTRDVVLRMIDPHRFPWIRESRAASRAERDRAIVASSALVAARRVETSRRKGAKDLQEEKVKALLLKLRLKEVPRRKMPLLDDAPAPGEFCAESPLGDTRADLVVRLYDRRVMPIECKVSNSAVNSFKRVNLEAAGKARNWLRSFGDRAVVPTAILSGVFNPSNLETAQDSGLYLFWSFRLDDLARFIRATRG